MKFKQGDRVTWDVKKGVPVGCGIVCGIATIEQPVMGSNVIVRLDEILNETYPYDTVCVWESWLSLEESK